MIGETERCHNRVEVVITVAALAEHGERQVHLPWRIEFHPVHASGANARAPCRRLARLGAHHAWRTRRCTWDAAEFAEQSDPLLYAKRLGAKVWINIRAIKRRHDLIKRDWECTRQRVAELLPSLAEARLDQSPELLLVLLREAQRLIGREPI